MNRVRSLERRNGRHCPSGVRIPEKIQAVEMTSNNCLVGGLAGVGRNPMPPL
jgi:hypothetical protein